MPINVLDHKDLSAGEQYFEGQETMILEGIVRLTGQNFDTIVIPFGRGLIRAAGDDQAVAMPSAAGQNFYGIAKMTSWQWQRNPMPGADTNIDADGLKGYALRAQLSVILRGAVAVKWLNAFTTTDPVYCIHTPTPATAERRGMFRAGAAANAILVPNARAYKSGAAGAVSPLLLGV